MTIAVKPGDAKPVGVPGVPKPAQLGVHNLDRHWRNARTHTLHDPIRWKYAILGNHALNGVKPPLQAWS